MASVIVLLAAVFVAGASAEVCDCSAGDGLLRARSDRNRLELERLSTLVAKLKAQAHVDDHGENLHNLEARVESIVGKSMALN